MSGTCRLFACARLSDAVRRYSARWSTVKHENRNDKAIWARMCWRRRTTPTGHAPPGKIATLVNARWWRGDRSHTDGWCERRPSSARSEPAQICRTGGTATGTLWRGRPGGESNECDGGPSHPRSPALIVPPMLLSQQRNASEAVGLSIVNGLSEHLIRRDLRARLLSAHTPLTCWDAAQRCAATGGVERCCKVKKRLGRIDDPLLAKPAQVVQHGLWPGTERRKRPSSSARVQVRWCRFRCQPPSCL